MDNLVAIKHRGDHQQHNISPTGRLDIENNGHITRLVMMVTAETRENTKTTIADAIGHVLDHHNIEKLTRKAMKVMDGQFLLILMKY